MTENDAPEARREELREHAAGQIEAVLRVMRGISPDPWLGMELTMSQFKVLFLLGHLGPSSVGRLASSLRVTLPTVTGILDRLVDAGLVERYEDPLDRRLVLSRLTPAGAERLERLESTGHARWLKVLDRLSTTALASLDTALRHLREAAVEEFRAERGCEPASDVGTQGRGDPAVGTGEPR